MTAGDRGEQLDAANKATLRKQYRRILDRGLGDHEGSALAGLVEELRANAEAVYGAAAGKPRPGRG